MDAELELDNNRLAEGCSDESRFDAVSRLVACVAMKEMSLFS